MAQHIPIEKLTQKIFRGIENAIKKDFLDMIKVKGSLKYRHEDTGFYKENENEQVYFTSRYIGIGFTCASDRGDFEIHYDEKNKVINQIYLVA